MHTQEDEHHCAPRDLQEELSSPLISLVIPTTGNLKALDRVISTILNGSPKEMLAQTELIVFVNNLDRKLFGEIEQYVKKAYGFEKRLCVQANEYCFTAEEFGCRAIEYAQGIYLWIVGDKRIFLRDGLVAAYEQLKCKKLDALYFNSYWSDDKGKINNISSIHLARIYDDITYKQFVMQVGFNFMATNFGAFFIKRKLCDNNFWDLIVRTCGPHFSHVTLYTALLHNRIVRVSSIYLFIAESKAYHNGDASEWHNYAKVRKVYLFYAWSLGLVRQLRLLIEKGIFDWNDVRICTCAEEKSLRRQVDEIYNFTYKQIVAGQSDPSNRLTKNEFTEIYQFLEKSCPENAIYNRFLGECYEASQVGKPIEKFIYGYAVESMFSSLIVARTRYHTVRLHPSGLLITPLDNDTAILEAYRILNPPKQTSDWTIIDSKDLPAWSERNSEAFGAVPHFPDDLYPSVVTKKRRRGLRKLANSVVKRWNENAAFRTIVPERLILRLQSYSQ